MLRRELRSGRPAARPKAPPIRFFEKKPKNSREQPFETPDRSLPRVQAEAIAQPRNDIGTYDVEIV